MWSRLLAQLDVGADRFALVDARWPEPELEAAAERREDDAEEHQDDDDGPVEPASALGHALVLRPLVAAGLPALRRLLFEEGDLRPATDAVLEQRAMQLLSIGRLRIIRHEPPPPQVDPVRVVDLSELAEPLSELVPNEPPPTSESQLTYVAFRLIDDVGTPVAGRAFSLTLPEGTTIDGVTGSDGRFSVDPVQTSGGCTLTLEPQTD